MQTKLHRWATTKSGRCFDDLFNLVCDPSFLVVAWDRGRDNKGARSAGVDGVAPLSIVFGAGAFLSALRDSLNEGFDFLGWRIQRRNWRGRIGKRAVYIYPSKKSLNSVIDKVRTILRRHKHRTLADLLRRLNPALRGWCNYFRPRYGPSATSTISHGGVLLHVSENGTSD